jgi:hypothetical protein
MAARLSAMAVEVTSAGVNFSTRLPCTLLGQEILTRVSSLKCREIVFNVNPTHYMKTLWTTLGKEESVIVEAVSLQNGKPIFLRWTGGFSMSWAVSKCVVVE